mmetsp:Transcript_50090/g.160362  ORF Transcript_50090/g.160362 Transcript_50090/m.160362 type:complete len:204 (+) Transcript_50090:335-946(+)
MSKVFRKWKNGTSVFSMRARRVSVICAALTVFWHSASISRMRCASVSPLLVDMALWLMDSIIWLTSPTLSMPLWSVSNTSHIAYTARSSCDRSGDTIWLPGSAATSLSRDTSSSSGRMLARDLRASSFSASWSCTPMASRSAGRSDTLTAPPPSLMGASSSPFLAAMDAFCLRSRTRFSMSWCSLKSRSNLSRMMDIMSERRM